MLKYTEEDWIGDMDSLIGGKDPTFEFKIDMGDHFGGYFETEETRVGTLNMSEVVSLTLPRKRPFCFLYY